MVDPDLDSKCVKQISRKHNIMLWKNNLAQKKDYYLAPVKNEMNFRGPQKVENYLSKLSAISFSRGS